MWVYGMIYGVIQAVFVVYAPTNKKDNWMFGFEEIDDNGAELLTFCVAQQFKVMDSYFER